MAKKRITDENFSKKIVQIAKEKFGSQKKMAESLNLTSASISDWSTGKSMPSLAILKELCLKAEISLDWLVLGKTYETDVVDINLFNEVVELAVILAQEEDLPINGSYFLGLYDLVNEELKDNPNLTPQKIITKKRKTIVRLRRN